MIHLEERVRHLFGVNIETNMQIADTLSAAIADAGQKLVNCLLSDRKILVCGNGGSSANCMHFTSLMLNHYEVERPSLPVFNLCSDVGTISSFANDNYYGQVYARQIQALGQENDILLLLTTSGNSEGMLNALHSASERGMDTIALSGGDGGVLANHLGPEDIELRVPSDTSARIREMHLFILHCFCDLIDHSLFGQGVG
jgi:D-sedoheptulose 7-phosphate isomerase